MPTYVTDEFQRRILESPDAVPADAEGPEWGARVSLIVVSPTLFEIFQAIDRIGEQHPERRIGWAAAIEYQKSDLVPNGRALCFDSDRTLLGIIAFGKAAT